MIDIGRIVELSETAEVVEDTTGYTAYSIATLVNKVLEQIGVDDRISPQQVYNDSNNGRINGVKPDKDQKVRYTEDEVEHYAAKLVASRTRVVRSVIEELPEQDEDLDDEDLDADAKS
jgi:hypothetical protein